MDVESGAEKPEGALGFAVVANVRRELPYGPGAVAIRRGTKHFPPGGKVWLVPPRWDWGHGRVIAVGRHRGSPRHKCVIVPVWHLENFRVQGVYSPAVERRLSGHSRSNGLWETEGEARPWVERWTSGAGLYEWDPREERPQRPQGVSGFGLV
ncbi:hypothetical protein [Streptomyces bambusae]|uniref:Uncharacterized protein n=1 Tax=Streptomyces bambusae TaxID=1550616 RepID=A0ABS6ZBJ2_9ACTN|nr:hypothetical protein [Streptomyces bambusae]MBW5485127.1 hypothetical protein [Streptomyces bambusae]